MDLRTAIGEPLEVDDDRWLDCLDEVVTVMHPRQLRLERVPRPAARLVFEPEGADARLALGGAADDARDVVIAGPAEQLALLAWGRAGLDAADLEVHGDRDLAAAVLGGGLTP